MRVAFLDPFSGASGDMILGALIDAGAAVDEINSRLSALHIPAARLSADVITRNGLTGTQARVEPEPGYESRSWSDIRALITQSELDPDVKNDTLRIFTGLAEAESTVHAIPVDDVHFHEVGALDTIVDIVGVVLALRLLDIESLFCGPLHVGGGSVESAHGRLPVPAPATALLLARTNAPIAAPFPGEIDAGELLTPTAAAILATLARFNRPAMIVERVGTGFGTKALPWANMARLLIGQAEQADQEPDERLIVLETNIDDMNPQFVEILAERLFAIGALDVWTTPIGMKKHRPAIQVSALCHPAEAPALTSLMIEQSTTFGVRQTAVNRIAADRKMESVETRWGSVTVKLKIWKGRVIGISPEYADCARIARTHDIAIMDIWNESRRIGEVYVGRKVESPGVRTRTDPIAPVSIPRGDS